MPGLDSHLFCLALNSTLNNSKLNTQKINRNTLLTNNKYLQMWFGSLGRRERAHPFPSKLSLWHKPEMPEDPLELTFPEKSLEESSLCTTRRKKKKKTPLTHWKLRRWRRQPMAHYPVQPAASLSTNLPANNTQLTAGWLGFCVPCRHFSHFKVSINSPLMCPKRIFKGLETHK